MAPVTRKAPVAEGVNFGDLGTYSAGGFNLTEGDYALEFDVRVHAYTKQDGSKGQEMLGVMVHAYPLEGGDPQEQFLSLGRKAIQSFAPDAATGKKVVPIPGAPAGNLAGMTNFNLFLDSLYQVGLPQGVFTNDISVLDGIHVHTQNVPEPESRKSMGAATGEVQQERRGPQLTLVVTEIKEDGKPWEGTGGIPEAATSAAPAPAARPAARAVAPKAAAKPAAVAPKARAAAPAPAPEPAEGNEELAEATLDAITTILGMPANQNGMLRLGLRTQAFTALKKSGGDDVAQAAADTFFADDDALNGLLGQLGYALSGNRVVVAG